MLTISLLATAYAQTFLEVEVRTRVAPKYPPELDGQAVPDTRCVVEVRVDETGRMYDADYSMCSLYFQAETHAALTQWEWYPFKQNGLPVRAAFRQSFNYQSSRSGARFDDHAPWHNLVRDERCVVGLMLAPDGVVTHANESYPAGCGVTLAPVRWTPDARPYVAHCTTEFKLRAGAPSRVRVDKACPDDLEAALKDAVPLQQWAGSGPYRVEWWATR